MNLLDGIVNAILGPDPKGMDAADRSTAEQKQASARKDAESMAFSASQNPGKAYFRPETSGATGTSSLGDMISSIAKLFSGGGVGS